MYETRRTGAPHTRTDPVAETVAVHGAVLGDPDEVEAQRVQPSGTICLCLREK